jgi:hypothetical protein
MGNNASKFTRRKASDNLATKSLYDVICPKCGRRGQLKEHHNKHVDGSLGPARYAVHHYLGGPGSKGFGFFEHNRYAGFCYIGTVAPSYAKISAL